MKSVAIYDRTGEVITLIMGQDNVPPGLEQSAIVVDLSDYERLIRIDLSDALHPKPVTIANIGAVEALVKEVQSLKKAVKDNQDALADLAQMGIEEAPGGDMPEENGGNQEKQEGEE